MLLMSILAGCSTASDALGFNKSGTDRYEEPEETDTGEDTGGDTGTSALQLLTLDISWDDIPNVGKVLYAEITYTDEPDDLVGGTLFFTLTGGQELEADLSIVEAGDEGDSATGDAYYDPDTGGIFFAIADLDDSKEYTLVVQAKDVSGNVSNELTDELDPAGSEEQ